MRGNRSESEMERELRSRLHRCGLRFRKHASPVRGLRCRVDILFTRKRIAVFVDGCFWHRCPFHGSEPKANGKWWKTKLDANVARDRRNDAALTAAGWRVLRFWAHDPVDGMVDRILAAVAEADTSERTAVQAGENPA